MIQSRRGFITGLVALVAAPAIVRAASLMPVSASQLVAPSNNALLTIDLITREAIRSFQVNNALILQLNARVGA